MNNYKWKLEGFSKGVDAAAVVAELNRIQDESGLLTPENIVAAAADKDSIIHPLFEWDQDKAAHNFRLQQARFLIKNITVTVVTDGEPRDISVFEVTTYSEGYKSIETLTSSDIDFLRENAKRQLNGLRSKLKMYQEFDKVVTYISKAVAAI